QLEEKQPTEADVTSEQDAPNTPKKPRNPPQKKPVARIEHHALTQLQKNTLCAACGEGILRKYAPAEFIRISGHSPYEVTKHVCERLRCDQCGEYFTAPLSEEAALDGSPNQKYGYSARALMVLNKYNMGNPFYRQESMQDLLHVPISASVVYDQCSLVADAAFPVYTYFMRLAADAKLLKMDDTTNKILDEKGFVFCKIDSKKNVARTGVYTSGIIATLQDDKTIVLFKTNVGHAGEFADEILRNRSANLPAVITLSDALNNNNVYQDNIKALCNAHSRREFADIIHNFGADVVHVLAEYQKIWINEDKTEEDKLTPEQRRDYHQQHTLPIMSALRDWGQNKIKHNEVEPNSGLGQAIAYYHRHYDGLTRFCHTPGIPLDNNQMEAMLKLAIRNRKNAYFFKTQNGADVADIHTSIIAT
ncbi:MAG TPA: IS66 family transposase, partial [Pseudomonadales bacterium]|nr:IS66 family transposase [Pseudomonadales bacterium]